MLFGVTTLAQVYLLSSSVRRYVPCVSLKQEEQCLQAMFPYGGKRKKSHCVTDDRNIILKFLIYSE